MCRAVTDSVFVEASRLGSRARAGGREARLRGEWLGSCPHVDTGEFYLASFWRMGWLEAEAAVKWRAGFPSADVGAITTTPLSG